MPTYEYQCEKCGYEFEKFQSITAPALRKCPKCGQKKLKRLMGTGAAVLFKGSGFYQTDYRTDNYKKGKEQEKANKGKGDNKKGGTKSKSKETKAQPGSEQKGNEKSSE